MIQHLRYDSEHPSDFIFHTMLFLALLFTAFGLLAGDPGELLPGLWRIFRTQSGLISDSIQVGGIGPAFVNAGLVTLFCIGLIRFQRLPFTGISVACLFLMAGFSLFGKDLLNIQPILLGGWLYARFRKEHFARYLYVSLFGTSLSPAVSEMAVVGEGHPLLQFFLMLGTGLVIGFLLPPIASYTLRVHQGYNLYNVGFAAGLMGMVLASFLRSLGYTFEARLHWSEDCNLPLALLLFSMFALMILAGFLCNGRSFRGAWRITRHSGRAVADFVLLDGYPVVLINMGLIGAVSTAYVLLVGGALNGPTLGGILTVCGFGAFGKHLRNILPVMLGVVLSSFLMVWNLHDPSVLLAALFSTALAPIAGQFGWKWGVAAGILHASVVLNVGALHGGLNLYNNGFAAGLTCIVLVPLIESFRKEPQL